jgi:uncharacterized protein YbjT (DUF2867 family)
VAVDFADPAATRTAIDGARAVLVALAGRGKTPAADEAAITRSVATAAAEVGVEHLIYTSVHRADEPTGVPHFEIKGRLERELATLVPRLTVLRPTTFAEALTASWLRQGIEQNGVLASPIALRTSISYVSTTDLARVAVAALDEPDLQEGPVRVAGTAASYADLLPLLSELADQPVAYRQIPRAEVQAAFGPDLVAMTDLFNRAGFAAEPSPVLHRLGLVPTPIEQWLRATWAPADAAAEAIGEVR